VIGAEPLISVPSAPRRHSARYQRGREQLPDIAIDVADAYCAGCREIGGPGDAAGALEFRQRDSWIAADMAIGRVVDDEVELRPVLRGLSDIGDVGEAAQVRYCFSIPGGTALVDADILDARRTIFS